MDAALHQQMHMHRHAGRGYLFERDGIRARREDSPLAQPARGFDFGPSEEISTLAAENAVDSDEAHGIDAASFNPFAPVVLKKSANTTMERAAELKMESR